MAQKDQRTSSNPAMPNMADLAETGRKQVEALLDMQKKFFDPQEVAAACQDWMNRRMELFTEDSRRLFADGQKFMNATTQMLSGGWKGGSS